MRLSAPQIISLFNLMMDFTRDARFELLDQRSSGTITVRVTNRYGDRGFTIPLEGGKPDAVPAMNRASEELKTLVGTSDAAGSNS